MQKPGGAAQGMGFTGETEQIFHQHTETFWAAFKTEKQPGEAELIGVSASSKALTHLISWPKISIPQTPCPREQLRLCLGKAETFPPCPGSNSFLRVGGQHLLAPLREGSKLWASPRHTRIRKLSRPLLCLLLHGCYFLCLFFLSGWLA